MKIKKIVAREGLIILGFVLLAAIIYFTGTHTQVKWEQYRVSPEPPSLLVLWANGSLGLMAGFYGYLSCLLVRFIIWSIKVLKQK
ncbi:MAG: hypothetical protein NT060_01235 [Candidatus Omnitrophica bacterium]|nr:hypothetical protein [Candidatus Omnitrophota bacterium]